MPLASAVVLADQLTLSASLVSAAPKGECVVAWVITDTNLQPAGSGSFTFTVANDPVVTVAPETTTVPAGRACAAATTAAATSTPGAGGGTATTEQESGSNGPLGLFRLFSNLGLAVLFGSFVLIAIAWPEGVEYILTVRFLRTTWMSTVASTYLFVGALAANQAGTGIGSALAPTGWGDLLDTTPGKAALVRMVFVAASAYAVMRPERVIDPGTQLPALLPPGIAVITMAFSRSEFSLIENATGAVHALAMAVWLGGLILLTRVVLTGPGDEDLMQRVSRVDSMTAPLATRLRRALGIEALIGVLVLALTSWLLALTPPGLVADGSSGSLQLGAVHSFQNAAAGAEVTVAFSERVGANDVRI